MILLNSTGLTVLSSAIVFLVLTLLLVILLLVAKHYLVPSGKVKIDINNGTKELEVESGNTLLNTLHDARSRSRTACPSRCLTACCRSRSMNARW